MTGPQSPSPERAKYTPNQVPRRNAVYAALSGLRMLGFAFFPRPLALARLVRLFGAEEGSQKTPLLIQLVSPTLS
jgi:hypothetical protein